MRPTKNPNERRAELMNAKAGGTHSYQFRQIKHVDLSKYFVVVYATIRTKKIEIKRKEYKISVEQLEKRD
jgi:hypothetical protein